MTTRSGIPSPRTQESVFAHYIVHDGTVTDYAPGSFIALCSADGRVARYALTADTRIDAARLQASRSTIDLGQTVNLTARLDARVPTATTIRVGAGTTSGLR